MELPNKIDLHIHTTVSDGTDPPEDIIGRVKAAGLELFSVTDHDAVKSSRRVLKLLRPGDPAFLTGIEFSCRDEKGKYHILDYGYDPDSESMRRTVGLGHGYRMKKVRARLEFLAKEFGFRFPPEEIDALLALDNPGKPHIGNLMVKYGYAADRKEAIREYIDRLRLRDEYVRPEEAIRGILGGGGIPVLAHPVYGSGEELVMDEEMDERLRRLMDFGLQGVEAFYSGFTDKLRSQMLSFAERYGLYITAGSDYNGTNKLIDLGDTGLDDSGDRPEGLRRFLSDANIIKP